MLLSGQSVIQHPAGREEEKGGLGSVNGPRRSGMWGGAGRARGGMTRRRGVRAVRVAAGIAKGVRRIVAVTGAEAQKAIADGEALTQQLAAAEKLADVAELDKALTALKQVR